jgi:hypothetical protein
MERLHADPPNWLGIDHVLHTCELFVVYMFTMDLLGRDLQIVLTRSTSLGPAEA